MRQVPGDRVPAAPATMEGLWDATATGSGTQTLTWDAHQGSWTLVLMNADAAAGISVVAAGGARVPYLTPIGVGLLVVGGLLLAAAVAMLVAGAASGGGTPRHVPPATDEPEGHAVAPRPVGPYPAALTATLDPSLSRWQWLVKWFLAIPHVVVLAFLWPAFVRADRRRRRRDPVHGALPAGDLRPQRRDHAVDVARDLLRLHRRRDRRVPALHPAADRLPGRLRRRLPRAGPVPRPRAGQVVAAGPAALARGRHPHRRGGVVDRRRRRPGRLGGRGRRRTDRRAHAGRRA